MIDQLTTTVAILYDFSFTSIKTNIQPEIKEISTDHFSSTDKSSWHDRLITVGQFCVIGGLGAIFNVLPLLLTLCTNLRKNEVNIMVMNLSLADLMLCVSFLFGQTFYILWHETLPKAGCHFLSFFHFTMAFASFIFPPTLAINRYVSLYHNHAYRRIYSKKNVIRMIGIGWAFCSLVPLIFMLAGKTGYDDDNHHCCMVVHDDIGWTVAYWIVIIAPLLIFCDGTMIYCNYRIYRKLNEHAIEHQIDKNIIRKHKEVLYFLIADMMFPICFHSIYHIFKFILVHRTSEFLKRFFISLYLLNSILRGLVTLVMLRPYRTALKRLLKRALCIGKKSKRGVNRKGNWLIGRSTNANYASGTFTGRDYGTAGENEDTLICKQDTILYSDMGVRSESALILKTLDAKRTSTSRISTDTS